MKYTHAEQPTDRKAFSRHALCRAGLALLLCLMATSLCTACFVTARNTEEVTVGGGITF